MISIIRSTFMALASHISERANRVNILFLISILLFSLIILSFAHPIDHRLTTNQLTAHFLAAMP